MKTIKYAAVAAVLSFSLTACTDNKRDSATLGGTQDTSNVQTGTNASGTMPSEHGDTSQNHKDSSSNGNANPTGRMSTDTPKKGTKP